MNEKQQQAKLVMRFSQEYPELHGHLFEVNNNTMNAKHGANRLAMGMVAGVADLIFIIPNSGKMAALEQKVEGSKHPIDHIKNQIEWGKKLINSGGYYLIGGDIEEAMGFLKALIVGKYEYAELLQNQRLLMIADQIDKNTVRF